MKPKSKLLIDWLFWFAFKNNFYPKNIKIKQSLLEEICLENNTIYFSNNALFCYRICDVKVFSK